MLINSVVLILEETLEAALLISMLMAMISRYVPSRTWLYVSLFTGAGLAYTYSLNLNNISEWFDYAGQEVVNAFLQAMISLFLIVFSWVLATLSVAKDRPVGLISWFVFCAAAAVVFSLIREGAEILLYLKGFVSDISTRQSVLIGAALGFGIGVSVGVLLYYGLINLSRKYKRWVHVLLLALFSGNMLSQATVQLIQADLLPSTKPFWNSSTLIPESSILGHLLYALIGYESTPGLLQVMAYLIGALCILISTMSVKHHQTVLA